ncbi:hypothetical protein MSG28_003475, partial [Choristoneura fumiferana]
KVEPAVFHQYSLFDIKVDPGLKDDDGNEFPRPFTKNQMRKWLKKVKWENHKVEKRTKEKARAKQRRQEARAANIDLGPSRKSLKKMKFEKCKQNTGIIIDLSFDNLMIEKDRFKVIKQILRCYSVNRRSQSPLQFHITAFSERAKSEMSRHNGYENWDIEFHTGSYLDIFPKESLVYLSSESENVIEKFEENTYYIIGGLVDHNKHKGLCHKIAQDQNIRHGQFVKECLGKKHCYKSCHCVKEPIGRCKQEHCPRQSSRSIAQSAAPRMPARMPIDTMRWTSSGRKYEAHWDP